MTIKIWVFIEQVKGLIAQPSLEALGEARRLAGLQGGAVSGLLFGQDVAGLAATLIAHGADEVLLADDATLAEFRAEAYGGLLVRLAREQQPALILAGATTRGRDLLGWAAVDLETSALADVIALGYADGQLTATRPVYAGKLFAATVAPKSPVLVSLRPRAFPNSFQYRRNAAVSASWYDSVT